MHAMVAVTMPGIPELIIILVVLLLLFGAKRLPEIARSVGKSSKEFKKGLRESAEDEDADEEEHRPTDDSAGRGST
jgi:sec-independent protein translocase protein TatA